MSSTQQRTRSFQVFRRWCAGLAVGVLLLAPLGCTFFRAPSPPQRIIVEPEPEPTPYEVLTSAERRARWNRKSDEPEAARQESQMPSRSSEVSTPASRETEPEASESHGADSREVAGASHPTAASAPVRTIDPARRGEVIRLYRDVYLPAIRTPVTWQGNIDRCDAGTEARASTEAARRMVNYYRVMAGLRGDIVFDPALNAKCRQAALSFLATPGLSHAIPRGWACYSRAANEAAGNSNIALGYAGAEAVAKYMEEPWEKGWNLRHRQWILYDPLKRMGSGSVAGRKRTNGYRGANALWVKPAKLGPKSKSLKWVAWPPRGYVPYPVVYRHWSLAPHVNQRVDLRRANVTMRRENGEAVRLKRGVSTSPYAPDAAVAWIPEDLGFESGMRDQTFEIEVSNMIIGGNRRSYRYSVTVIDPSV